MRFDDGVWKSRLDSARRWLAAFAGRGLATQALILAGMLGASIGVALVAVKVHPLAAAALIAGLVAGARFVTRPFYALLLTVLFIPMDALDDYFPAGLSAAKIMSLVTIASFAVYWLAIAKDRRLLVGAQTRLILLFLLTGLLGSLFARYPLDSLESLSRFFRLFLLVQNLVDTPQRAQRLVLALLIAVCVSAAFGLHGYLTTHLKNYRAVGLTQQANKFGNDTVLMAPIALALIGAARRRLPRALLIAAAGLLAAGVVISFSRGSMLALLACLPLLVWRLGGQHRLRVLVTLGLLAALILPFVPERFYARFSTLEDPSQDFSVMRRQTYLVFAQRMFFEQPWLGIGLGNFEELYLRSEYRVLLDEQDKLKGRPAHNMVAHLGVEMGLLGVGLFLGLFGVTWRDLRRSQAGFGLRGDALMLRLAQGLEISLVCFLLIGLFGSRQYEEFPWLVFALSSALARLAQARPDAQAVGDRRESGQVPAAQAA